MCFLSVFRSLYSKYFAWSCFISVHFVSRLTLIRYNYFNYNIKRGISKRGETLKVRSVKCVSFCDVSVFEELWLKWYNKVRKEFFPFKEVEYVSTSYYHSSLGIRYLCGLFIWWQCFVYSARTSKSQTPVEDRLRDSVFVFPSSCDLCGLVCILLWLEYLSTYPVNLAGHFCFKTKKIPMRQLL